MVKNSAKKRFFPDTATMSELNFKPRPVRVMTPMIIPAVAQATATGNAEFTPATKLSKILASVRRDALRA